MDSIHDLDSLDSIRAYRTSAPPASAAVPRSWLDLDAEIGAAVLSFGLIVASLCGQCDQTVLALAMLGLGASLAAIVGWMRRTRDATHGKP